MEMFISHCTKLVTMDVILIANWLHTLLREEPGVKDTLDHDEFDGAPIMVLWMKD